MENIEEIINFDKKALSYSIPNDVKTPENEKELVTYANRKFSCTFCSKRFFTNQSLTAHEELHSDDERKVNTERQGSISSNYAWKQKVVSEKGIACTNSDCNFAALDAVEFNKHLLNCEGVRLTASESTSFCICCNLYFSSNDHLNLHNVLRHQDQIPVLSLRDGSNVKTTIDTDPRLISVEKDDSKNVSQYSDFFKKRKKSLESMETAEDSTVAQKLELTGAEGEDIHENVQIADSELNNSEQNTSVVALNEFNGSANGCSDLSIEFGGKILVSDKLVGPVTYFNSVQHQNKAVKTELNHDKDRHNVIDQIVKDFEYNDDEDKTDELKQNSSAVICDINETTPSFECSELLTESDEIEVGVVTEVNYLDVTVSEEISADIDDVVVLEKTDPVEEIKDQQTDQKNWKMKTLPIETTESSVDSGKDKKAADVQCSEYDLIQKSNDKVNSEINNPFCMKDELVKNDLVPVTAAKVSIHSEDEIEDKIISSENNAQSNFAGFTATSKQVIIGNGENQKHVEDTNAGGNKYISWSEKQNIPIHRKPGSMQTNDKAFHKNLSLNPMVVKRKVGRPRKDAVRQQMNGEKTDYGNKKETAGTSKLQDSVQGKVGRPRKKIMYRDFRYDDSDSEDEKDTTIDSQKSKDSLNTTQTNDSMNTAQTNDSVNVAQTKDSVKKGKVGRPRKKIMYRDFRYDDSDSENEKDTTIDSPKSKDSLNTTQTNDSVNTAQTNDSVNVAQTKDSVKKGKVGRPRKKIMFRDFRYDDSDSENEKDTTIDSQKSKDSLNTTQTNYSVNTAQTNDSVKKRKVGRPKKKIMFRDFRYDDNDSEEEKDTTIDSLKSKDSLNTTETNDSVNTTQTNDSVNTTQTNDSVKKKKRGRPRKAVDQTDSSKKAKNTSNTAVSQDSLQKNVRHRKKVMLQEFMYSLSDESDRDYETAGDTSISSDLNPKKVSCPQKKTDETDRNGENKTTVDQSTSQDTSQNNSAVKRKRGRPRKSLQAPETTNTSYEEKEIPDKKASCPNQEDMRKKYSYSSSDESDPEYCGEITKLSPDLESKKVSHPWPNVDESDPDFEIKTTSKSRISQNTSQPDTAVKRKRGRPKKISFVLKTEPTEENEFSNEVPVEPKKRGRPRKKSEASSISFENEISASSTETVSSNAFMPFVEDSDSTSVNVFNETKVNLPKRSRKPKGYYEKLSTLDIDSDDSSLFESKKKRGRKPKQPEAEQKTTAEPLPPIIGADELTITNTENLPDRAEPSGSKQQSKQNSTLKLDSGDFGTYENEQCDSDSDDGYGLKIDDETEDVKKVGNSESTALKKNEEGKLQVKLKQEEYRKRKLKAFVKSEETSKDTSSEPVQKKKRGRKPKNQSLTLADGNNSMISQSFENTPDSDVAKPWNGFRLSNGIKSSGSINPSTDTDEHIEANSSMYQGTEPRNEIFDLVKMDNPDISEPLSSFYSKVSDIARKRDDKDRECQKNDTQKYNGIAFKNEPKKKKRGRPKTCSINVREQNNASVAVEEKSVVENLPQDDATQILNEPLFKKDCSNYAAMIKMMRTPSFKKLDFHKMQIPVTCGRCNEQMTRWHYLIFHQLSHYYLCWIDGEHKIDLNNYSLVEQILKNALKVDAVMKRKVRLHCESCDRISKSIIGHASHVVFCKQDAAKLLVDCDLCGKRVKPCSLKMHYLNIHNMIVSGRNKNNQRGDGLKITVDSKKPYGKTVLSREQLLNDNAYWESLVTSHGLFMCMGTKCKQMTVTKEELRLHLQNCEGDFFVFNCNECGYVTKYENEVIYHWKTSCKKNSVVSKRGSKRVTKKPKYLIDDEYEDLDDINAPSTSRKNDNDEDFMAPDRASSSSGDEASSGEDSTKKQSSKKDKGSAKGRAKGPPKKKPQKLPKVKGNLSLHRRLRMRMRQLCRRIPDSLVRNLQLRARSFTKTPLVLDYKTNIEEWLFKERNTATTYLPSTKISMHAKFDESSESRTFNLFESDVVKDAPVCFVGGPVSSVAWASVPGKFAEQYLAVATLKDMDESICLDYTETNRANSIQIWKFPLLDNINNEIHKPELVFVIGHHFGPVLSMGWCPSGGFDGSTDPARIGILAAATHSGCIAVYCIPKIECGSEINVVEPEPDYILRVRDEIRPCMTMVWNRNAPHTKIFAGFATGKVSIWDITKNKILRKKNVVYAHTTFRAHLAAVYSLDVHWMENDRFLVTCSYKDRETKIWDLHNLTYPMRTMTRYLPNLNCAWAQLWIASFHTHDYVYKGVGSLSAFATVSNEAKSSRKSMCVFRDTIWSVAYSSWNDMAVVSTNSGSITSFSSKHLAHMAFKKIDEKVVSTVKLLYPVEGDKQITAEEKSQSVAEEANYSRIADDYTLLFQEKPTKVIKPKKPVTFDVDKYQIVSINKTSWNPNYNSFNWLAVGYQNGFVRIIKIERYDRNHLSRFYRISKSDLNDLL